MSSSRPSVSTSPKADRPILDYEVSQNEDGTLDLVPTYIEQLHSLIFTFVRGDGNKKDLLNFI